MTESIDKLKYFMDMANFITIGYSSKDDLNVSEFLREYNPVYINEYNLLNVHQINEQLLIEKRNTIIDSIIYDDVDIDLRNPITLLNSVHNSTVVIHLNNIITDNNDSINRTLRINDLLGYLQNETLLNNSKIVLLSPINRFASSQKNNTLHTRSSQALYMSDLVLVYDDSGEIFIQKNRYG